MGAKRSRLSGDQKQIIAIARALLLLDEATVVLNGAMMKERRACLLVVYRLTTV